MLCWSTDAPSSVSLSEWSDHCIQSSFVSSFAFHWRPRIPIRNLFIRTAMRVGSRKRKFDPAGWPSLHDCPLLHLIRSEWPLDLSLHLSHHRLRLKRPLLCFLFPISSLNDDEAFSFLADEMEDSRLEEVVIQRWVIWSETICPGKNGEKFKFKSRVTMGFLLGKPLGHTCPTFRLRGSFFFAGFSRFSKQRSAGPGALSGNRKGRRKQNWIWPLISFRPGRAPPNS